MSKHTKDSGTESPRQAGLKILVVEDEKLPQAIMAEHLAGQRVEFAGNLAEARSRLEAGQLDLCFIDLNLGDGEEASGLKLIPLAVQKGIYSVVMSAYATGEMIGKAHELGCKDYYVKGNERANLTEVLAKYRHSKATASLQSIFKDRFVTQDSETKASVLEAVKYATSDLPIMLLGPSGAGKECLAKIVHEESGRQGRFVEINCAAFAEDLLESELFGHRKGAFTGATDTTQGKLLAADKGTLFLDEVGAMSLAMQTKLLKAIEQKSFYPMGSDRPQRSDFRLITATAEDVQQFIMKGRMRFDFFQRIHGLTVKLKPLSQRKGDILPLVEFFTRGGKRLHFMDNATDALIDHPWPGNARELDNVVRLLTRSGEGSVTRKNLREILSKQASPALPAAADLLTDEIYRKCLDEGLHKVLLRITREAVRRALAQTNGNKTEAMAVLRISARRLYSALRAGEAV
jgi:DNA-binding NtrC family response regulator